MKNKQLNDMAGKAVLIPSYISDGPSYTGPLLCHIGPKFVQVVTVDEQDADGNLIGSQIQRTEAFEADAPVPQAALEWDDKYAQAIFENLAQDSKELCEKPADINPKRTAVVQWSDGSTGAIMFWGESCYVSAIFFEGPWKGEYTFDLDAGGEQILVPKGGAAHSLILAPGQVDEAVHLDLFMEYYVWCDDDCQNKTSSLDEAKKWRDEFTAEGRASWIIDGNNEYITDGEVSKTEQPRG